MPTPVRDRATVHWLPAAEEFAAPPAAAAAAVVAVAVTVAAAAKAYALQL